MIRPAMGNQSASTAASANRQSVIAARVSMIRRTNLRSPLDNRRLTSYFAERNSWMVPFAYHDEPRGSSLHRAHRQSSDQVALHQKGEDDDRQGADHAGGGHRGPVGVDAADQGRGAAGHGHR